MVEEQKQQEATEAQEKQEDTAAQAPTVQEADELKVVVQLKGRRAIISVGKPGCDPVIRMAEALTNLDSTHDSLWLEVDNAITQACVQWAQAKQYPAHKAPPKPVVATRPVTSRTQVAMQTKVIKGKAKPQEEEVVQHGLPLL